MHFPHLNGTAVKPAKKTSWTCRHCGYTSEARAGSQDHVQARHEKRCEHATAGERAYFKRNGRWPRNR